MSHIYCPECGFQNPEAANYCSKCGTLLRKEGGGDQTMTFAPEFEGDASAALEEIAGDRPALVVRSGGGRSGESFGLPAERTTIGRSPECDVFLDDVTVSRKHAVILRRDGDLVLEDQGSLNGTFLNRRRIESGAPLHDGDELQIGKYRLIFLQ